MKKITCFLFSLLIVSIITGCGGGGSSAPSTTATISGTISLPSNTNAKLFEVKPPFYAELFSSPAHAEIISDLTKLTVTASGASTNPDATGKYTLTVNAGTNIELTVTSPSGNVVLSAIVPSVSAGSAATQNIDTTTTAVALIYKQNTALTIAQISSSAAVTNVKDTIEAALTNVTVESITNNVVVGSALQTAVFILAGAMIDAGVSHACAIKSGGVKCWGDNFSGELGNGSWGNSSTPVNVSGLSTGVTAVTVGGFRSHTCALTTSGGVKCWGDNSVGQLGNGSTTESSTPVDVSGLSSGVSAVSAGLNHTCALTTSGGVKCWGYNYYGQLGNGTATGPETCGKNNRTCSTIPVDVAGLSSGVRAVISGFDQSCAILSNGGVKCWGMNDGGQLGDGSDGRGPEMCGQDNWPCSTTPVDVTGLSIAVSAVSTGYRHTCALTTSGGIKCWGANYSGQLGNGSTIYSSAPVDVTGLTTGVLAISAGGLYTCAVLTSGGVKCWGVNYKGQLGNGSTTDSLTPEDVNGLSSGVSGVTAGAEHTCALLSTGGVKCWGLNDYGQLGNGTSSAIPTDPSFHSTTPVDVVGFGG